MTCCPLLTSAQTETKRIAAENLGLALVAFGTTRGSDVPTSPANGQLWVDTSNNPPELKIYNGASFSLVSFLPSSAVITNPSSSEPSSPVLGQLWLDTSQTPDELKVYDGANFVRVDPLGITQAAGDARYLQITAASTTYLPLAGGTLTGTLTLDAAPTANLQAATKKYVDDEVAGIPAATDLTPAGTVIYTARSTAPTGYLKANGAAVSRTTYATLFSAIGTTYGGGDGSTTFNLPDLRGEFVRGLDDGRGVDTSRTLGSSQGDATAMPSNAFTGSNQYGWQPQSLVHRTGENNANRDLGSAATNQGAGNDQHQQAGVSHSTRLAVATLRLVRETLHCWLVSRPKPQLRSLYRSIVNGQHQDHGSGRLCRSQKH
jgi:microcystin-dependent protein